MTSDPMPEESASASDVIRHFPRRPFPGDGSFSVTFMACLLAITALVASAVYVVNPLGTFSTHVMQPVTWRDRDEKLALYLAHGDRPQLVVLGSSMMTRYRPSCITRLTGLSSFNFAVGGAKTEDYLEILRLLRSAGALPSVQRLLVGIEPNALHPYQPSHPPLTSSRWAASAIDARFRVIPRFRLDAALGQFFGVTPFEAALRSLRAGIRGRTAAPSLWEADGFYADPGAHAEVRRGASDDADGVARSLAGYQPVYADFPRLSPVRVAALWEFLLEAHAERIAVDAFIVPFHPDLVRGLSGGAYRTRRADVEALLRQLGDQGLLRFHDIRGMSSFGGDPRLFYDGAHMMEGNTARLLATIYGGGRSCAVQ